MGTRSVRLDSKTEKALARLTRMTGLNISEVIKRGISSLENEAAVAETRRPWDIYRQLDLGPGGYSVASSVDAKTAVREQIRRKHNRWISPMHHCW